MDGVLKLMGIMTAVLVLPMFALTVFPALGKGLTRYFERRVPAGESAILAEVEELRARVAVLEGDRERIVELEERLDFAERLLARQREAARFPASGEGS